MLKYILDSEDTQNQVRHSSHYVQSLLMILQTVSLSESTISFDDLTKVSIQEKRLVLANAKLSDLTKGLTTDAEAHIVDLDSTIAGIYEGVNADVRLALITFASVVDFCVV